MYTGVVGRLHNVPLSSSTYLRLFPHPDRPFGALVATELSLDLGDGRGGEEMRATSKACNDPLVTGDVLESESASSFHPR